MSDALIASLQKRLDELTGENASLKTEAKTRRISGKKLAEELEQLRAGHASLAKDRDEIKARFEAAPNELQARIDELTGQVRTRDHRDAFASVKTFEAPGKDGKPAKFRLNDGVTVEDVWNLTQYKPEGDKPEGAAVTEQFGKALQAKPYLFAEATPETGTTDPRGSQRATAVHSREAGPGPGKGLESPTVTATGGAKAASTAGRIPGRI